MLRTIEEAKGCVCPVFYNSNIKTGEVGDSLKCRADKCMAWEIIYICEECGNMKHHHDTAKECGHYITADNPFSELLDKPGKCRGSVIKKARCKLIFKGEEVD